MKAERAILLAGLLGLPACASSGGVGWEDRCGPAPGPQKPLASLGHDEKPFEIRHLPEGRKRPGYLYRFEREDSGTTESLRGIHRIREGRIIVVGDHGTALVRDAKAGWQKEDPRTTENLYAIVPAAYYENGTTITEELRKNLPYIAVGSNGAAVHRDVNGVWQVEQTGTSAALFAVSHFGSTTVAVGAGGAMVKRSKEGVWQAVKTRTTADLHSLGGCGEYLCVVGTGGAMVLCKFRDEEIVCIPRPPPAQATLRVLAERGFIMGDGVWLTQVLPKQTEPRPPPSYVPWPTANAVMAGEEILAVDHNRHSGIGELLAVGRRSTVWFQSGSTSEGGQLERVKLPFEVDFHDVAYELVDGFLVGDQGTIVHLGVEGFTPMHICLL
ncbi:hypothetical protein KEG38_36880 [Polyangium jinanense]|uniref:hypothetical protein n=1 Tax=Polyangium jinanense TaxID=2829994 RepID=UPI0023421DBE|nr:hypothetical protein [Polyangium jinanense]MDC3959487.1 hypothetical protein [Polyangium jinanense]